MRLTAFMLVSIFSLSLTAQIRPFNLVIDPGHGGYDVGAIRGSFRESDITLKVAEKIQLLIESELSENINVVLTRKTDTGLTLEKRVKIAEEHNADLFISLHANSSSADYVRGMEFYFKKGISRPLIPQMLQPETEKKPIVQKIVSELTQFGNIRQSLKFNQILQKEAKAQLSNPKTVIKRAPFYVIEKTTMPSALIEIGFISNLSEAKLLLTEQRQQEIAESIAKSIFSYKNSYFDATSSQ